MSWTTTIELKNIDPDDVGDVLLKVERSFGFKFGDTELKDVKTFGELCDIIASKVQGNHLDDCTTQQAFYKVRQAIARTLGIDGKVITVDTQLQNLFPRKQRHGHVRAFEKDLGLSTKLLRPKHWVTNSLLLLLFASLGGLIFYVQIGLSGLAISIVGLRIATNLGRELDLKTVGELSRKISREHYRKARRSSVTVNRIEIARKTKELFMTDLDLDERVLTREATFK